MNLDNYTPKGQLEGFPKEVIAKMLEEQVKQGNPENIEVFEGYVTSSKNLEGFDWRKTEIGDDFWVNVIARKNFDVFFSKYPKSSSAESKYPKEMLVWDVEEFSIKKVVQTEFVIHGTKYFVTQSIDESTPLIWKHAKDIEEVQPPIPKTLEERVEAIEKHLNLNK